MSKPNRKLRLTLKDVLAEIAHLSGGGHPHDFIDRDSATIRLEHTPTGRPRIVIEWEGHPDENPCDECEARGVYEHSSPP
jgi:hypothetical protein